MGSYGIGVSRIIAAIIEANNDQDGIIWPESVAPYNLGLINLKVGNEEIDKLSNSIYTKLTSMGCSVLLDDRDERAGVKFSDMDLIGIPWQIIIGPKGIKEGFVEFKNRKTKDNFRVKLDEISNKVKENVFLSLGK